MKRIISPAEPFSVYEELCCKEHTQKHSSVT